MSTVEKKRVRKPRKHKREIDPKNPYYQSNIPDTLYHEVEALVMEIERNPDMYRISETVAQKRRELMETIDAMRGHKCVIILEKLASDMVLLYRHAQAYHDAALGYLMQDLERLKEMTDFEGAEEQEQIEDDEEEEEVAASSSEPEVDASSALDAAELARQLSEMKAQAYDILQENRKLRQENKTRREEAERLTRENAKLKEENAWLKDELYLNRN